MKQRQFPQGQTYKGHEVYPMPMFIQLFCQDLETSSQWYQQALGFSEMFALPNPQGNLQMVHLRRDKYQDLMLLPAKPASAGKKSGMRVYLNLLREEDSLEELQQRLGDVQNYPIVTTQWSTRELEVVDADGHILVFSQKVEDLAAQQRWREHFEESP